MRGHPSGRHSSQPLRFGICRHAASEFESRAVTGAGLFLPREDPPICVSALMCRDVLQYSTEGGVLCSGDQDWVASTVAGPGLFLPRYRRLRTRGVRGSAPAHGRGCLPGMRFRSVIARRNVLPAGQSLPCLGERVTGGLPNARDDAPCGSPAS
jgi:hypothetical protein